MLKLLQSELARLCYRLAVHAQQVSALSRRVCNADAVRQGPDIFAEGMELVLDLRAKAVEQRAEMVDLAFQRGHRGIDILLGYMLPGTQSADIYTALRERRRDVSRLPWAATQ